ncbi:NADPH:quinone reductase-like Zn-dependent oxidoreductase [Nocardia transvalensis]|uniref:NADPH:quinone reductase-like Zn-dependent oxidoreductase n=1 Tax=Nocardia transvalensis TaxID=37333 RepID=A0A7W9ULZ1_9NOCA|nr:NADP-dependent oxidoreductase [Nocardia transvalensis]MBB5918048.1 NADPH:quinone reductase-like Zn-dependent oxidoreductase [Nocardia transvalensis]
MLAIGFDAPGGPEVLRALEVPQPHAGPGEVRIRVEAATVNPSDVVTRSGAAHDRYRGVEPPYVPGWDAAGVIDEAAPDSGWRVGDRVVAVTKPVLEGGGAYAEWIVVSGDSVAPIPDGADPVAAATLPMNGLTARIALDALGPDTGRTIAVTGAAGAVGGYVIQLAKHAGFTVIADAAPADRQLVTELGADIVVPRGSDVAQHIREHAPDGVDAVIDGALLGETVLPAIRDNGSYVALRPPALTGGVQSERGIAIDYVMVTDHVRDSAALKELSHLAGQGILSLRVARTFPAAEAADAHRLLEAGGVRGRLVLRF